MTQITWWIIVSRCVVGGREKIFKMILTEEMRDVAGD